MSLTGKNIVIAYLLWFFLGSFSIHRFYLGRAVSGLIQLMLGLLGIVLTLTLLGAIIGIPMLIAWLIWWVLDAYFVYVYVERFNSSMGIGASRLHFTHTRG
jgi:TM2 domain-containing membrane protein YozV